MMINTKMLRILLFVPGLFILWSCQNNSKNATDYKTKPEIQHSVVEKKFLIGSWKNTSEAALDFTLFNDGTAHSDNMKTLIYKSWKVTGDRITFTIESIGNGTSSIADITYIIEKLTQNRLILKKGKSEFEYRKN